MDTTNQEQVNEFAGNLVLVMLIIIAWEFLYLFTSDDIKNKPAFL